MRVLAKVLAGGVAAAALAGAAPAAAQYYPGYGYGGNPVGQIINQVFGGYGYNGYNSGTQVAVQQCAAAVEQRLNGGYGGYNGYGGGYGGGRVLAITHADTHSRGFKIKGIASSGMNAGYGYGGQAGDLSFRCEVDYRGFISDLHIDPRYGGYGYAPYNNGYNYDYSQYGYRRY